MTPMTPTQTLMSTSATPFCLLAVKQTPERIARLKKVKWNNSSNNNNSYSNSSSNNKSNDKNVARSSVNFYSVASGVSQLQLQKISQCQNSFILFDNFFSTFRRRQRLSRTSTRLVVEWSMHWKDCWLYSFFLVPPTMLICSLDARGLAVGSKGTFLSPPFNYSYESPHTERVWNAMRFSWN